MRTSLTCTNRKSYLDFLRILSMFMVVLIHVIGSTFFALEDVTSSLWCQFNLVESAIRWCVPVFVMISGALLLDPEKELTIHMIWSKYIRRVATAFVFWSAVYAAIDFVKYPRNLDLVHQVLDFAITVILKPADHLWFVYMIIGLYIITPMLRKIVGGSSKKELQYWLVIMFLFGLLPDFLRCFPIIEQYFGKAIENAHLNFLCGYVFYFVAGYYFSRFRTKREMFYYVMGILGYLGTAIFTWYASKVNGVTTTFYNYLYPNTAAIAVSIFVAFSARVNKAVIAGNMVQHIKSVSDCMFGVYLCHVLFITVIDWLMPAAQYIAGIGQALLKTAVVFGISLGSTLLLRKIKIVRKYIL